MNRKKNNEKKTILDKVKAHLSERVVFVIVSGILTTFSFLAGNVYSLYSTYTGLPARVGALENHCTLIPQTKEEVAELKRRHEDTQKKLDTIENKIDNLLIKLAR